MPNGFDRVIVSDFGQTKVMCGFLPEKNRGGRFGLKEAKRVGWLPTFPLEQKIAQINPVKWKMIST